MRSETHVLKLLKKVAGHLAEKLIETDFQQYHVDECVWYKGDVVFLCYVDDEIWISMKDSDIDNEIRLLQNKGLKIEDYDCVGANVAKTDESQYAFTPSSLFDVLTIM